MLLMNNQITKWHILKIRPIILGIRVSITRLETILIYENGRSRVSSRVFNCSDRLVKFKVFSTQHDLQPFGQVEFN